ncbi:MULTISPECIES: LacI family DNA-binding transcriptional regulator [Prauserella salsuginis group]|uniref:LacI family DNA-binding transcriptional regulator n=1 Tax=Prauserella salsuginis TaxID=387889 RepID=A0ABW6G1C2_9PSEU|nr:MULTISPECIES: LacI family DNA-binding transcriptional regulator [Prauserella salsuginis group]MCR3722112.1 transcriptional regulator, LacI family [Prauserella flava]MCR3736109.1 transcriptional regulator, LacI family [Prauserella salsuginis]
MSGRRVTIRDVAERADVSISTVSHAFSGSRPISAETRERITRAANELGYEPNPSARSLRTGRSGIVGLILRPRFALVGTSDRAETFNRLVGSVATEALRRKTGLIHVPDIDDPRAAKVPMDGCIVAHPYSGDRVLTEVLRRHIPVVTVEEDPERPELPWAVRLDYPPVVDRLLDHLKRQHASDIMLLTGTESNAWNVRTRESYRAWCRTNGVPARIDELSEGLTHEEAAQLIGPLLAAPDRPDAIVVATSDFAALIARVAAAQGVRVPDELMIASFTDSEHSRTADPAITAMDLNHENLAKEAVELMLARIAGAEAPEKPVVISPVLHLRASTLRSPH